MPYKTIADLSASIRDHLTRHAQEIYTVAWAAVKTSYQKSGDKWVKK